MKDRRTQIIDAATAVMSRRGFAQTSVEDVIREAGLSGKAHFYHYFRSKEELGHAVLLHRFERFAERSLAILHDPMAAPMERLQRFIDEVVANHAELSVAGGRGASPCGASPCGALAAEMAASHEGFRERVEVLFERWTAQIRALLWEVRPQLRAGTDIDRLARFVVATLEGALSMSRVTRDVRALEGVGEELKQFIRWHARGGTASDASNAWEGGA